MHMQYILQIVKSSGDNFGNLKRLQVKKGFRTTIWKVTLNYVVS